MLEEDPLQRPSVDSALATVTRLVTVFGGLKSQGFDIGTHGPLGHRGSRGFSRMCLPNAATATESINATNAFLMETALKAHAGSDCVDIFLNDFNSTVSTAFNLSIEVEEEQMGARGGRVHKAKWEKGRQDEGPPHKRRHRDS